MWVFLSWLFVTFNPSEFPCFETISKLHKYCKTMQSNFFLNHVKKQVSHGLSVHFLQNKLVTLKRPQHMLSTKVNFLACMGNSTVKMIKLTSHIPSTVIITSQLGSDHLSLHVEHRTRVCLSFCLCSVTFTD